MERRFGVAKRFLGVHVSVFFWGGGLVERFSLV